MKLKLGITMCALLTAAMFAFAADAEKEETDVKSGLKNGDFVDAFNVLDVTGPSKGESLCYRCKYGGRPVVSIFTRTLDKNVVALIKDVDTQVGEKKELQLSAFVVYLPEDADAAEKELAELAETNKIANVPLTIYDGQAGPPEYKLSKDADVTVLMWAGGQVKVNHGFAKGTFKKKTVKTVAADTAKILEAAAEKDKEKAKE